MGRIVAFGGRLLPMTEEQSPTAGQARVLPKYLNSPESALYKKGTVLYGLFQAKDAMRRSGRVLVVEGYIDLLALVQHGCGETVAVLGTALTPHHLGLLRRYADEVILFFDADRAGTEAARRAEELLEQSADPLWWALDRRQGFARGGLRLKVATLPAGHDPDTFLRQDGRDAFEARCAAARNLLLFAIDRIFAEEDTASPRGKTTGVARLALLLSKVQNADEAIELGREAARRLGIDPSDLWTQAQRLQAAGRAPSAAAAPAPAAPPGSFDRDLVKLMIHSPAARTGLGPLADPQDVGHAALRAILIGLVEHAGVTPAALLQRLSGEAERALLSQLLLEDEGWEDPASALTDDMRRRLELRRSRRRARELRQAIAQAEADGRSDLPDLQVALQKVGRLIPDLTAPKTDGTEDVRS
jgi:DNA primase